MYYFNKKFSFTFFAILFSFLVHAQNSSKQTVEKNEALYRPYIHFTPKKGWMNDPNGMFLKDGIYHLYYQHYPDETVWGPMHWGHATSRDLIHWEHRPIAIYPDSLGLIFSGSAVMDEKNSSGLGVNGKGPIVAIFTQHNMEGEKNGTIDFQNQSIAFSNDNGETWKMYNGNPVIKNPGIKDFRDPKVMWHEGTKKWIMTLAVKNKVSFYSSSNLKDWNKESDFGVELGSHDGVWECPDLFSLKYNNSIYWVLTSSINPGGPNKGSATQYFIGNFDGHFFKPNSSKTKWVDYGADNYAGVTWFGTGERKISMGWMSNWIYAQQVPTQNWRSATTIARDLSLGTINNEFYLKSMPVKELAFENAQKIKDGKVNAQSPYKLNITNLDLKEFSVTLSNDLGESICFGYDQKQGKYYIDRTNAGEHNFNSEFAAKHIAPRISESKQINLEVIIDKTSIELFADNGFTVMTDIFFPNKTLNTIKIKGLKMGKENLLLSKIKSK